MRIQSRLSRVNASESALQATGSSSEKKKKKKLGFKEIEFEGCTLGKSVHLRVTAYCTLLILQYCNIVILSLSRPLDLLSYLGLNISQSTFSHSQYASCLSLCCEIENERQLDTRRSALYRGQHTYIHCCQMSHVTCHIKYHICDLHVIVEYCKLVVGIA